jgi:diacylglycerol kinase (ATP)
MHKKSVIYSVRHAVDGITHCLRTQKHMRLHFVLAFFVLLVAVGLRVVGAQLLALLFSITVVIVAEMLNTSIEVAVDMIKPTYDPRAKVIKDVAAGAVLISSLSAVAVGTLVFLHSPVVENYRRHLTYPHYDSSWPELAIEAMMILLILFVACRMSGAEGSILRGGPISGRAAFGFFALVLIVLDQAPEVRIAASLMMVALVIMGRSTTRDQNARQIVLGSILGIMVPGLVMAAHYAMDWSHVSIHPGTRVDVVRPARITVAPLTEPR